MTATAFATALGVAARDVTEAISEYEPDAYEGSIRFYRQENLMIAWHIYREDRETTN